MSRFINFCLKGIVCVIVIIISNSRLIYINAFISLSNITINGCSCRYVKFYALEQYKLLINKRVIHIIIHNNYNLPIGKMSSKFARYLFHAMEFPQLHPIKPIYHLLNKISYRVVFSGHLSLCNLSPKSNKMYFARHCVRDFV